MMMQRRKSQVEKPPTAGGKTLKEFMETLKTGQTAESTIKAYDVKAKGAEKRVKKLERDMEKLQIKRAVHFLIKES